MSATKIERDRKDANARFSSMMDETVTHVRVGQGRRHRTGVALIGYARDLHGPDGVCTCCPRRLHPRPRLSDFMTHLSTGALAPDRLEATPLH